MCKALSLLVTKSGKIYYKVGVDSHDTLQSLFQKKDKELKDDKLPPDNTFCRVEITPKNGNYCKPDQEWKLRIDEEVKPNWWNKEFEKPCFEALEVWKEKVYGQINLKEINNPIHPFKIDPPKKITFRHKKLLKEWDSVGDSVGDSVRASVRDSVGDSVWDSVRASVRDSVGDSVWDSVRASVRDSVRASVRASVWDSVGAYISYSFPKIKTWKYCDKRKSPFNKIKGNPFRSAIKLWRSGLVPSYDSYNEVWRLHGGPKAEILFEIKKSDLIKL